MEETNVDSTQIRRRSVTAVKALISRTFIVQVISFLATLVLTYYLEPEIYGVFYLVSSVINFFAYFSDIGLAAALIQKKEKVSKEDLATTFTIQQLLVLSGIGVLYFLSPQIQSFYNISNEGLYLLYAMGVSFFLSSLKTIPSILLEREIQFQKLVVPQILETLVFNVTAVYLAINGYGISTFTYAVLLRGIVGLLAIYYVYPWKPSFGIYLNSVKSLFRFGVPYQLNTFLAIIKDDGMTIILSKIIGAQGVGYIGWASKWAGLPLRTIMDNVTKVSFPVFSRLQDNKQKLSEAVSINLKFMTLLIFPTLIIMAFISQPLASIILRYQKWLPAIIPLYFYLYNSAWASVSTSLTNLLNATGNIKSTFKLMVFWTTLTWLLFPALAIKFGYLGVAYATGLVATSSIATILLAKSVINFSISDSLRSSTFAGLTMFAFLLLTKDYLNTIPNLIGICLLSLFVFSATVYYLEGKALLNTALKYIKNQDV